MPLVSILDELKKAQAGGYAIPCFDTFDQPHPKAFVDYVRRLAQEATVPVSIILTWNVGRLEDG
jgi:hypothetical protein